MVGQVIYVALSREAAVLAGQDRLHLPLELVLLVEILFETLTRPQLS